MSDLSGASAGTSHDVAIEGMTARLAGPLGADFIALARQMGMLKAEHLRELLDAGAEEQSQLAMAWMRAATLLEAEWEGQARRQGSAEMTLARYLEIRLPSPRRALEAQQYAQRQKAAEQTPEAPPSPRERESAQRRIRLEAAIREAREAIRRVDAIDRLESADRQAIVQQLEDLISVISRRLNP